MGVGDCRARLEGCTAPHPTPQRCRSRPPTAAMHPSRRGGEGGWVAGRPSRAGRPPTATAAAPTPSWTGRLRQAHLASPPAIRHAAQHPALCEPTVASESQCAVLPPTHVHQAVDTGTFAVMETRGACAGGSAQSALGDDVARIEGHLCPHAWRGQSRCHHRHGWPFSVRLVQAVSVRPHRRHAHTPCFQHANCPAGTRVWL